jgi:phenylalanine-4-hydroxylase
MTARTSEKLTSKERCCAAIPADDYRIDQQWSAYSNDEHERWDRLFAASWSTLQGRACDAFLDAVKQLQLSKAGIPDMSELSDRLEAVTGWRIVPVAGLVPDEVFFEHLANKRFPAGAFIRSEAEMEYLEEPDVFHDIFGHVPLLSNPEYAAFMEAYGKGGRRALERGQLANLARLYWYTIEFGLIRTRQGLRLFGAGIMSSTAESAFALEDAAPNRVAFDLTRVMRTKYIIDDFQKIYFVIESFEDLVAACEQDFGDVYDTLRELPDIEANELHDGDDVIHSETMACFHVKQ